jgi:outer membrane protein OmpA-like peptidoglycan-associated protein/osmotically-inducible protein OsmY
MRCNPLRWLWGLLPLALLAWFTGFSQHMPIEADLKGRVEASLSSQGLGWAKAAFEGRDGVLTGEATDEADQTKALQIARDTWGVRVMENRTRLIDKADTYTWAARRDGRRVVLQGMVPNNTVRASILAAARQQFPDADVADEMRLARGVPALETWTPGTTFALRQLGQLRAGEAKLDGLGLTIAGEAASEASYRSVRTALTDNLPRGVRLVEDRVTPPIVRPYTWAARAADNRVTLTGYVPSEAARNSIRAAARAAFPRGGDPIDQMRLGGGAPADFGAATTTSLRELARLEEGSAQLNDSGLNVAGLAADQQTADTARRGLRSGLPASYRLTDQIRFREPPPPPPPPTFTLPPLPTAPVATPVSPYTGGVEFDGSRVILTGFVPDAATRDTILQAARQRFPGRAIDDRLNIGSGEPNGWVRCFDGAMAGVARLGNGRANLSDRRVEIVGRTEDGAVAEGAPADMRRAMEGACEIENRIAFTPPPPPPPRPAAVAPPPPPPALTRPESIACQVELKRLAEAGTINFEYAKADLLPESIATLDRLAAAAKDCPRVTIDVEGHTDSEGTPERNQRLSDRRAATVVNYLVRNGVDPAILAPVGYGETRPLAPNDTPQNRAMNRRIEFTVRE